MGRFWSDSLVHDQDMLNKIVNVFGELEEEGGMHLGGKVVYVTLGGLCLVAGQDKVCLGTDYPFPLGEYSAESKGTDYVPGHLIDSMDWDEPLRRQVLVSTARYQQCGGAERGGLWAGCHLAYYCELWHGNRAPMRCHGLALTRSGSW